MRPRVFALAAALWANDAVPGELLDNLEFFMNMDVEEASAEESLFEVAASTAPIDGVEESLEERAGGEEEPSDASEETK